MQDFIQKIIAGAPFQVAATTSGIQYKLEPRELADITDFWLYEKLTLTGWRICAVVYQVTDTDIHFETIVMSKALRGTQSLSTLQLVQE